MKHATILAVKYGCSRVRELRNDPGIVSFILSRQLITGLLLTTCSVGYNVYLIWFVYTQWSHDYPRTIQLLEALPTIALGLQSLCQGFCLLFATACPVSSDRVRKMSENWFIAIAYFQMVLNIYLTWHPLTMVCIAVRTRDQDLVVAIFELFALLEVTFRIYSITHLHSMAKEKQTAIEMEKSKMQVSGHEYPLVKTFDAQYSPKKNLASSGQERGDKLVGPHSDFPVVFDTLNENVNVKQNSIPRGSKHATSVHEHPPQSKVSQRKKRK